MRLYQYFVYNSKTLFLLLQSIQLTNEYHFFRAIGFPEEMALKLDHIFCNIKTKLDLEELTISHVGSMHNVITVMEPISRCIHTAALSNSEKNFMLNASKHARQFNWNTTISNPTARCDLISLYNTCCAKSRYVGSCIICFQLLEKLSMNLICHNYNVHYITYAEFIDANHWGMLTAWTTRKKDYSMRDTH